MSSKLPTGTLDRLWRDPANWRNNFYVCAEDPRSIVPKRLRWLGWTPNWAHGGAVRKFFVSLIGVVIMMALVGASRNPWLEGAAIILLIAVSIIRSRRLSAPEQFEELS